MEQGREHFIALVRVSRTLMLKLTAMRTCGAGNSAINLCVADNLKVL
jgi:hypothetical protein